MARRKCQRVALCFTSEVAAAGLVLTAREDRREDQEEDNVCSKSRHGEAQAKEHHCDEEEGERGHESRIRQTIVRVGHRVRGICGVCAIKGLECGSEGKPESSEGEKHRRRKGVACLIVLDQYNIRASPGREVLISGMSDVYLESIRQLHQGLGAYRPRRNRCRCVICEH